jgi:hypothetical protein
MTHQHKITLGEMRASGVRGLSGLSRGLRVLALDQGQWRSVSDDMRLSDLADRFTCAPLAASAVPMSGCILARKLRSAAFPRIGRKGQPFCLIEFNY